jgi:UDP-N-acetylmuramate--alanine ligase
LYVEKLEHLPQALIQISRGGDVIVTMGAGSIGSLAAELPTLLPTLRLAPVVERRRS